MFQILSAEEVFMPEKTEVCIDYFDVDVKLLKLRLDSNDSLKSSCGKTVCWGMSCYWVKLLHFFIMTHSIATRDTHRCIIQLEAPVGNNRPIVYFYLRRMKAEFSVGDITASAFLQVLHRIPLECTLYRKTLQMPTSCSLMAFFFPLRAIKRKREKKTHVELLS